MKRILLMAVLLTACSSPQYQPQQKPQQPGYKEAELAHGLYLLSYFGSTQLQQVSPELREFWQRRAAELCPQKYHSFVYFEYKARPKDGIGVPVAASAVEKSVATPVVVEGVIQCNDSKLSYEQAEELLVKRKFLLRN